jgi:hypothetical protein
MNVTRTSMLTGVTVTREVNVTEAQLADWQSGTLAQRAMPDISAADREFIMTGVTAAEWDSDVLGKGGGVSGTPGKD